jgi:hypothetical protein
MNKFFYIPVIVYLVGISSCKMNKRDTISNYGPKPLSNSGVPRKLKGSVSNKLEDREKIVCEWIQENLQTTTDATLFQLLASKDTRLGKPDIDSNLLFNIWQSDRAGRWSLSSEILNATNIIGWATSSPSPEFPIYHGVFWNSKGKHELFSVRFTPN